MKFYQPEAIRTADGTEVRIVETFQPRHRATLYSPVRRFRYAGRICQDEKSWRYPSTAPKHRIPLDRSESDRG